MKIMAAILERDFGTDEDCANNSLSVELMLTQADSIYSDEINMPQEIAREFVKEIERLNAWDAEGSRRAEAGIEAMGLGLAPTKAPEAKP